MKCTGITNIKPVAKIERIDSEFVTKTTKETFVAKIWRRNGYCSDKDKFRRNSSVSDFVGCWPANSKGEIFCENFEAEEILRKINSPIHKIRVSRAYNFSSTCKLTGDDTDLCVCDSCL